MLTALQRSELRAPHGDVRAHEPGRTIAIAEALQICDEPLLAGVGIGSDDGLPGPAQVQIPGRVLEDPLGGTGVRIHLESPLEAMQAPDVAQDYETRAAWGSRLYYLLGRGD